MKRIMLLGASGSIGTQTIDVIKRYPERFSLYGVSALKSIDAIEAIVAEHKVSIVAMDPKYRACFKDQTFYSVDAFDALIEALPEDIVIVNALMGSVGLVPTIKALEKGHDVLLANKETLVVGGELIAPLLKQTKARLIPIDSEHSALRECLRGHQSKDIEKVIITASGGSFRDYPLEKLKHVSVKDALNHPNWSMGEKITIDSATMMNKVFEVIEAHYLYALPFEKIEALQHEESIVHAIIYYKDGNVLAHLGNADMRIPILTALEDEERLPYPHAFDLAKIGKLHFKALDENRYPLFQLGVRVAKKKGCGVVIMNAANEVAVDLFLREKIAFLDIAEVIKDALDRFDQEESVSLEAILRVDKAVREYLYKQYLKDDER